MSAYTISLKCPNCGAAMQGDVAVCSYCGAHLQVVPELQQMKLLGFACPRCGTLADKTARYCPNCGEILLIKCPDCRHDIPLSAHVCPNCGLNRVARSLRREADEKRKAIESQAVDRLADLREQVARNETFQRVRDRLSRDAEHLQAEARRLDETASVQSARAVAILVAAFAAPLAFCALVQIIVAAMGKGNAWAVSCLGGIPVFLIMAGVSAVQFAKSREARRKAAEMKDKAADMQLPDAWRNYATAEESRAIQAVLEWSRQQEVGILEERDAALAEVNKWLAESVRGLK